MVEFPLRGLDLSEFCQTQTVKGQLPVYDLYGVINHHGGILGGHYTAYARLNSKESLHQNELGKQIIFCVSQQTQLKFSDFILGEVK